MKTLILMRHAKSDWSLPGQPDKDRSLNDRGRAAAPKIGAWLRAQDTIPEAALVSAATRTRETWGLLGIEAEAQFRDDLYLAEPDRILAAIHTAPECETLLVLGHNPGMEWTIAGVDGAARVRTPTAATAIFKIPVATWADMTLGTGRRIAFVTPKSLP